ncbi:Rieske 2Fe-2S family protein [Sphingobium sp. AP50]|uniref:aromatic ring-hydroxylating oxygenase subunit alpha n=1 Tax=Sphingobium sp. AP50 TaxID=1884369 RepID=UPI0008B61398|nr:SRPBCC family protein [Sphingobium sp. AP50]SEJ98801.1 Rieske 2Fe-2S family protein [Sphingobium sp. AP50]
MDGRRPCHELPQLDAHVVQFLFGQEIIVVNAGAGGYREFHNVCTRRGSRIRKQDGKSPLLVCPYHAWSLRLTGELHSVKDLPNGTDAADLALRPVTCHEVEGLIFYRVNPDVLPDLAPLGEALRPAMRHQDFARNNVAVQRKYPTRANLNLVLENFFECHHCRPAQPAYFRMNGPVAISEIPDSAAADSWQDFVAQWRSGLSGSPYYGSACGQGGTEAVHISLYHQPIGLDRKTASRGGDAIAALMGEFDQYDCDETAFHFDQLCFASSYNDHIVLFQFMPHGPEDTDVALTWLVDEQAELASIHMDDLTFMWNVTMRQDRTIGEQNAAGVASPAYWPEPYTALEARMSAFVCDYVATMESLLSQHEISGIDRIYIKKVQFDDVHIPLHPLLRCRSGSRTVGL